MKHPRYLWSWCGALFIAIATLLLLDALGYLTVKDVRNLMGLCLVGCGLSVLRQKSTSAITFWGCFPLLVAFVLGYIHFSVRLLETLGWLTKGALGLLFGLTVFFACGIGGHLLLEEEGRNKEQNHAHLSG